MKPRNGHTLNVVIVARISGCQNQKEVSLDDQVAHGKQAIADIYDGPCNFHTICTTGKGERLDRPELAEVETLIRGGTLDLVVMEDVGRMVRGTAAVELWGMAVDREIRCIAPLRRLRYRSTHLGGRLDIRLQGSCQPLCSYVSSNQAETDESIQEEWRGDSTARVWVHQTGRSEVLQ